MKILFPFEEDANHNNAFVFAVKLAKRINAELIMLNAFSIANESKLSEKEYHAVIKSKWEAAHDQVNVMKDNYLAKYAPIGDDLRIRFEYRFKHSVLVNEIFTILKTEPIDYVVFTLLEKRKNNEMHARALLSRIADNFPTKLLIVPEHSYYLSIDSMIFATDFRKFQSKLSRIDEIISFAELFDAHLHILHVVPENQISIEETPAYNRLKQLSTAYEHITLKTIYNSDVMTAVHTYIKVNDVDVMATIKQDKGFFERIFRESFTTSMLIQAEIPIFILMDSNN